MPKILVFEPHGDDALISCYHLLNNSKNKIVLVTFSDRPSEGLKEYFPNIVSTVFLEIPDLHYDYHPKYNTHAVNKRYQAGEDLYSEYNELMHHLIKEVPTYMEACQKVLKYQFLLEELLEITDAVYLPFGLFHPNHFFVRYIISTMIPDDKNLFYYVDKPYFDKRYIQQIWSTAPSIKNFTIPYEAADSERKKSIFKSVYPTEANMLRFFSNSILYQPDIYMKGN